jgi:hypothetical protein
MDRQKEKYHLKCYGAFIDHFNLPSCFQFRVLGLSTCKSNDKLLYLLKPDLTLFKPGSGMRPTWRDAT